MQARGRRAGVVAVSTVHANGRRAGSGPSAVAGSRGPPHSPRSASLTIGPGGHGRGIASAAVVVADRLAGVEQHARYSPGVTFHWTEEAICWFLVLAARSWGFLITKVPITAQEEIMSLAMTAAERERFLADPHVGVLSVAAEGDRAPLAMPVWYLYEPGGEITFATGQDSRKMALIRKAGRVSLVVQNEQLPYGYVSVEGVVTSVQQAHPEQRRALAERYLGPEGGAQYLDSTRDVAHTMEVVSVRPERWLSRDYTKVSGQ
jgi:PPOX class probable F420-dependent enzyme